MVDTWKERLYLAGGSLMLAVIALWLGPSEWLDTVKKSIDGYK